MKSLRAAVLVSLWTLSGCQGPAHPAADTGVHLLLTDAPVGDPEVRRVLVTLTRIDVYSEVAGAWEPVIDYGPSGRTFDLLTLRDGNTEELGAFQLPPGTYDQIRLLLNADNQIEVDEGTGPELLPLTVPSGEQTGIKLVHPFTVTGKGPTEIVVDFDAGKSVKRVGHGWQVQPVVQIVSTTTADTATRVVGPKGGTVRLLNEAQVDIPPGALAQDTEIFIKTFQLPEAAAAEQGVLPSSLVKVGPPGTTFAAPVRITVWYDPAELRGRPLSQMAFVSRASGQGWSRQESTFDAALGTCSSTVTQLSTGRQAVSAQGIGAAAFQDLQLPTFGTAAQIASIVVHDVGGPVNPGATRDLSAEFWSAADPLSPAVYLAGAEATWQPEDATLKATTEHGCVGLGKDQCTTDKGCYNMTPETDVADCINDGRFATATGVRWPGCRIHVLPAGAPASATSSSWSNVLRVRRLIRLVFHHFYVQDDSDNFGSGEIYWQISVGGQVVIDHPNAEGLGDGDFKDLGDQASNTFPVIDGESVNVHAFFADDDGGLNGGADEAWFDRGEGLFDLGEHEVGTTTNNGNGSLDIHLNYTVEVVQ